MVGRRERKRFIISSCEADQQARMDGWVIMHESGPLQPINGSVYIYIYMPSR